MTDKAVEPAATVPVKAVTVIDRGDYHHTLLSAWPGWYLHHVLGGVAKDLPWDGLSEEEKAGVQEEAARRGLKSAPTPVEAAETPAAAEPAPPPPEEPAGKGSKKTTH